MITFLAKRVEECQMFVNKTSLHITEVKEPRPPPGFFYSHRKGSSSRRIFLS